MFRINCSIIEHANVLQKRNCYHIIGALYHMSIVLAQGKSFLLFWAQILNLIWNGYLYILSIIAKCGAG